MQIDSTENIFTGHYEENADVITIINTEARKSVKKKRKITNAYKKLLHKHD